MEGPLIDSADYELHQRVKAAARRHFSKGHAAQAIAAISDCIQTLLSHKQVESANDLSKMVSDYFKRSTQTAETLPAAKALAVQVYEAFNQESQRLSYLRAIIDWAESVAPKSNSDLYLLAARASMDDKDYSGALLSFSKMTTGIPIDQVANAAVALHLSGALGEKPSEAISIPVCKLAEISPVAAHDLLMLYIQTHPALSNMQVPFSDTILTFLRYLCLTLQRDAAPLYKLLLERYRPALDRNPKLADAVRQLGRIHYKIQPPSQQNARDNLFGNFLQNMLGGGMRS